MFERLVKEEDGTDGDLDYLTVRLQHSRDEFPFVVLLFFLSLILFLSIAFYHVDDDTNIGRDGVSFSGSTIFFLSSPLREEMTYWY